MKTKTITFTIAFTALILCLGVFLFPLAVYASQSPQDGNRPTVTTTIAGDALRIEASGGFLGVEAIFVNGIRFNFRVDGVLRLDLVDFRYSDELSIHAVDFAGNRSNTLFIANPHYVGRTSQATHQQGIPVTSPNPFTPDGQASVLDNARSHDDKEFFTFTTPAGNVFFLVVDRQRGTDNVYFLNAVTEQDLIALAEQSGTQINVASTGGIPVATTPQTPDEQPDTDETEQPDTPTTDSGGGNGTMIFLLVAMAIAGGVGYYFKIVRPKQQGNDDYDDEDEDEDEDLGDELEFENELEADDEDEISRVRLLIEKPSIYILIHRQTQQKFIFPSVHSVCIYNRFFYESWPIFKL